MHVTNQKKNYNIKVKTIKYVTSMETRINEPNL